jgi:hypothetical protein
LGTVPRPATSIFEPVIAPFLIFVAVFASFLMCLVPTEFFGSITAA